MTKILNLDDLGSNVDKTIRYKGVDHPFQPMTVEEFIAMLRAAEVASKDDDGKTEDNSTAKKFEVIRETIGKAFPSLKGELGEMPMSHLMAIFEFLQRTAGNDVDTAVNEYKNDAAGNGQPEETPLS